MTAPLTRETLSREQIQKHIDRIERGYRIEIPDPKLRKKVEIEKQELLTLCNMALEPAARMAEQKAREQIRKQSAQKEGSPEWMAYQLAHDVLLELVKEIRAAKQ